MLTLMTYNLRFADPEPPNSWPERRPVMRELLKAAAPDVIGTQEGRYEQLREIASDLPDYDWIGLGREGGSDGEMMAIFYRRHLTPTVFQHFWLSDTPLTIASKTWGNELPRMVTWVRFCDPRGRGLYVFNTHLDYASAATRAKSIALITETIRRLSTHEPVILMGDFNEEALPTGIHGELVRRGYQDLWEAAEEKGQPWGTVHFYEGPKVHGRRIDWMLSTVPLQVKRADVLTFERGGQYPSDHFPVVAEVGW